MRRLSDLADICLEEEHSPTVSDQEFEDTTPYVVASTRKVNIKKSPYSKVFYNHHALQVALDKGAEINLIKAHIARHMGINIQRSMQIAMQADGNTPLMVIGEIHICLFRKDHILTLNTLVIEELPEDVLAGMPFLTSNDIIIHPIK